jgi:hypothetical protein
MSQEDSPPASMSLDELLEYREVTERISAFLQKRLREHLSTLWPLLAPGRVLGRYVSARDSSPHADQALAELTEKYKQASGSPFELKPDLDQEALASIGSGIQIHPFEYSYEAHGAKAGKKISMTSPIRWIVTYSSEYSFPQIRNLLSAPGQRRAQPVGNFVINALAFQLVLGRSPSVGQLLRDLRYEITLQALPGLEKLPLLTCGVPLPSFRPCDDLLLTAIRLSGVPAFIELIDVVTVQTLKDPLRAEIEALSAK